MKKLSIYIALFLAFGTLGSELALAQAGPVVAAVPGNTVVVDQANDLQLRNCDPTHPAKHCSLPPTAPLSLPEYFDINTARITQLGGGWVDLAMTLQEPIPAAPPQGFISYFWQFEGGCVDPQPGNKAGVQVVWHGPSASSPGYWEANWFEIVKCDPREIEKGDPVDFQFTEDGVKVRVLLADLLTAIDEGDPLFWFAGVRRVPFVYNPSGTLQYTHTVAADYAPSVLVLTDEAPFFSEPEEAATWKPQMSKSR